MSKLQILVINVHICQIQCSGKYQAGFVRGFELTETAPVLTSGISLIVSESSAILPSTLEKINENFKNQYLKGQKKIDFNLTC